MLIADRYDPTGSTFAGGMGEVHECIDHHLNRKVMLKNMQDGHGIERLIDEQKALVKLRSKHVVQLLDIVSDKISGKEVLFLVLEYIDGVDLEEGQCSPDHDYFVTMWQIAAGLSDIHGSGIIHRDIKPNNFRIDQEGVVKILDFGLARETGKDAKTKSLIGTLSYMAPELIGDATISFSSAVDVYAFGVSALSMLSRPLPKALKKMPPVAVADGTVATHVPELPNDIAVCLEACLSHNPKKRPSMASIRDAFARHILKDRHRARMVMNNKVYELNSSKRDINLTSTVGNLNIHYNGYDFLVQNVTGEVYVNNAPAAKGQIMHSACVITFGSTSRDNRSFVTFAVSNPEVMA